MNWWGEPEFLCVSLFMNTMKALKYSNPWCNIASTKCIRMLISLCGIYYEHANSLQLAKVNKCWCTAICVPIYPKAHKQKLYHVDYKSQN